MASPSEACFCSILIPAYNEEHHIAGAISSVKASLAAVGVEDYEVIVCDNNSSDSTGKLATEEGARVVFEPHNQIARARNAAAKAARGEWFIFVDADSEVSADLLDATIKLIRLGTTGAGGALVAFDRNDLGWHVLLGLRFWNTISRTMGWAAGSYVFCRREAWEETGGFDEDWYAAEEILFSRALTRWCRARGLRFKIITGCRLRTSSRKVDTYSIWQMVKLLAALMRPGALKSQSRCQYWYDSDSRADSWKRDCGTKKKDPD